MIHYHPAPSNAGFILLDVLKGSEIVKALPLDAATADPELVIQVLEEAAKFAGGVVALLSRIGDEEGCSFGAEKVTTPPGARDAYLAFWQAGWPGLACAEEDGGQGLPAVLAMTLYEWLSAANHGWTMDPGLKAAWTEQAFHAVSDCLQCSVAMVTCVNGNRADGTRWKDRHDLREH
ncbi:hypothetical protein [Massilia niastensis]|uniref:hypothetical protein n=1 Tax=Massilia niastensis TaxID=544911 RepID=UPI00039CD108|nr:hypothetical protein [Massilia niastensis]